jgi:hypothetical protein
MAHTPREVCACAVCVLLPLGDPSRLLTACCADGAANAGAGLLAAATSGDIGALADAGLASLSAAGVTGLVRPSTRGSPRDRERAYKSVLNNSPALYKDGTDLQVVLALVSLKVKYNWSDASVDTVLHDLRELFKADSPNAARLPRTWVACKTMLQPPPSGPAGGAGEDASGVRRRAGCASTMPTADMRL